MAVIAGKVAPRFMGAYNSSTTYQFYDAVTHNNKLYFCKKSGTVGKTPTGATDDNWFLSLDGTFADAASLGNETAEQWQTKIDNIQTTSRAALSTTGWYRVAKVTGAAGSTVILKVGNVYAHSGSDEHLLLFTYSYGNAKFSTISSKATNAAPIFSKARYTVEGTNSYLEVYFSVNTEEPVNCTVLSFPDWYGNSWKALDFIATSETVDGVTVTTTYDIPANASPVTDLDLKGMTSTSCELLQTSILEKAKEYTGLAIARDFGFVLSGDNYSGGDLPDSNYKYCSAVVQVRYTSAVVTITGIQVGAVYYPSITNYYDGSSWKGWKTFATTADLANYVSVSDYRGGSKVSAGIANDGSLDMIYFEFSDGTRKLLKYDNTTKRLGFTEFDGSMWSGENIAYIADLANYLLLSGDSTISGASDIPVKLSTGYDKSMIGFNPKGILTGAIGTDNNGKLIHYVPDKGFYEILDIGNVGSYALPIDGSVPMSGVNLWTCGGYGRIYNDSNMSILLANNVAKDTSNARGLLIANSNYVADIAKALVFRDEVNGALTDYTVLHTGNSAKVAIQESAPTDNSALWYDTVNKMCKRYVDGAWQA